MARWLSRQDTNESPDDCELSKSCCAIGCSWDVGEHRVDLDLQCVVVDDKGVIIDCAYYNNMKAVRAITHSGDEQTGEAGGIDELVWVHFNKVPAHVAVLVFVVAAYSGGQLKDVSNGVLHVLEDRKDNEIARFALEQSAAAVDVVAAMFRSTAAAGWTLRIIDEPARQGQHFMDILPLIADVVRIFIPSAPAQQKVAFDMAKGAILDLPQDLSSVTIGLGWDTDDGEVDLDVSAVLLNSAAAEVETVFFGNLESTANGIRHTGDNLTGQGSGDDEQIVVNLNRIESHVQQVIFVINIYTQNRSFRQVANPYCRVVDDANGNELCKYALREAGTENGLVVSKIARESGGRWGFHALGLPCRGKTCKESMPQIRQICAMDTRKLMARDSTTDSPPSRATTKKLSIGSAPVLNPLQKPCTIA